MDWIRVDVGLPTHPKVGRLARRLKISKVAALGHVVRLLCWVGSNKEHGVLNGTDPEDLADVCGWEGDPDALLAALEESGWLDRDDSGLSVHEWMDRQGRSFRARERQKRYSARQADVSVTSGRRHPVRDVRDVRDVPKEKNSCAETLNVSPPSPAVFDFPCDGKAPSWPLTEAYLAELKALFPGLDVAQQARLALAWIKANPDKRKTARGMPAFLTRWLTKATDQPRRETSAPRAAVAAAPKTYREWEPPR